MRHLEQGQQHVAADLSCARRPGYAEAVSAAGYFDVKATFDLSQVFIKLATKVRKAAVIGGLEDNVPRNLDGIQNLYSKPLCKKPSVRKTGTVPSLLKSTARNLSGQ
jgi:hypothetical protein